MSRLDRKLRDEFGPFSDQARFSSLYRSTLQDQAAAKPAIEEAQTAAFGSIAQRENPLNFGSVFRRENPAFAGAYDAQASASRIRQQQLQEDDQLQEERRRVSLMRAYGRMGV